MNRLGDARSAVRLYASVGISLVVLASFGGLGILSLYGAHYRQVTGRDERPEVGCFYCHRRVQEPSRRGDPGEPVRYPSPAGIAVSADGATLWVAAEGTDRLLEIDLESRTVTRAIVIPGGPFGVARSAGGDRLAVTARAADRVAIVDTTEFRVLRWVAAGREPLGVEVAAGGSEVFVANGGSNDVLLASVTSETERHRLGAGMEPYAIDLAAETGLLAVANRRVRPRPEPALPESELTVIDTVSGRVQARHALRSAHLAEGVAISADGSFVLVPVVRARNYLPTTQVARGGLMNSALAFVETHSGGRVVQFPLDEVNAYYADPAGVALSSDNRRAYVAHAGASVVSVVDLSVLRKMVSSLDAAALDELGDDLGAAAGYVLARIPTSHGPSALTLSADGRRLFVAERLADTIAVIDTDELEVIGRIDLGGPGELTAVRRGERVFHDASASFQGQFSCRSCHPDGHTDGLNWDFEIDGVGRNRLDTRSLRGIRDTAPFKWNGKNPDLATQCGPRFARVLTRSEPFSPQRLEDLVTYIESLRLSAKAGPDARAPAIARGRQLFFRSTTISGETIPVRQRCDTCHRPPLFTDRLMTDVGTGGVFDTPHLLDIGLSPPYLHDGRAQTLEEIWTVHSPEDTHGATNDMSKAELNDLVVFLKSL
ncbi:MAG: hypothetical protein ACE5GX_00330 [Thermoanaerobaculia bacterium]